VTEIGKEETLFDGDVGGVIVREGVGGALVRVLLISHVCLATLLVVVLLLLYLIPFLVIVLVTITCIWKFSNIMTILTTSIANPLGAGFVFLPFPLLEDLLKALNDKSHLFIVKLGGINWEPFGWCGLLLFIHCFEYNWLRFGCGGISLLQVDNVFGVFDHKFKAHKLANHLLGRHFLIPRTLTD
jgi:hypothetical protein